MFIVDKKNGKFDGKIETYRYSTDKLEWKNSPKDHPYPGEGIYNGKSVIDVVGFEPGRLYVKSNFIVCSPTNKCRKLNDLVLAHDRTKTFAELKSFPGWKSFNDVYSVGLKCSYEKSSFTCSDKNGPLKSDYQEYNEMNQQEIRRQHPGTAR